MLEVSKETLEKFEDIETRTKILVIDGIAICGFQEVELGGDSNEN